MAQDAYRVTCRDGLRGTLYPTSGILDTNRQYLLKLDDGREYSVPASKLELNSDGSYRLGLSHGELNEFARPTAPRHEMTKFMEDNMAKTVVGLFNGMSQADAAIQDLTNSGFSRSEIGVIAGEEASQYRDRKDVDLDKNAGSDVGRGAAKGAGAGAAVGGGLGLIAGLASLAIPGFGPVIAAGPIVAALTGAGIGAAAGGIIGGLTNMGVPEHEAEYYAEGIKRGNVLVTVRTDDDDWADKASDILDKHGAVDVDERSTEWRTSGWAPTKGIEAERERTVTGAGMISKAAGSGSASGDMSASTRRMSRVYNYGSIGSTGAGTAPMRGSNLGGATGSWVDAGSSTGTVGSDYDYDTDWRSDFNSRYSSKGYSYDRYRPAYSFGSEYARNERYRGKDWADIEYDARRDWESRGHGAWEDFKDAVRTGWEKMKGRG